MTIAEFASDWALEPRHFMALRDRAASLPTIEALQARDAKPVDGSAVITTRGDVAILHVKGVLSRYPAWYSDGPSYGQLRKGLQSAIDGGAKALLVVVDSPGGSVNGLFELAQAIYDARTKVPFTAAYVADTGASAAYVLASAVGKVYCSATATLGSLGVMTTLIDDTKALADAGLREYEIVNSASPKKSQQPADSEYRARVQQRIDDIANVLIKAVASYRGVRVQTVLDKFGQGDVLVGQRAVDAGLADGISDAESVIAKLQKQVDGQRAANTVLPFRPAAAISTTKGITAMNAEKIEKRRAKLGMSATASVEDIKAAWKARKEQKHAAKAAKLNLPPTASKEQIKTAKYAARAAAVGLSATAPKAVVKEREAMLGSNNAEAVRLKLEKLRRGE